MGFPTALGTTGVCLVLISVLMSFIGVFANILPFTLDEQGFITNMLSWYGIAVISSYLVGVAFCLSAFILATYKG